VAIPLGGGIHLKRPAIYAKDWFGFFAISPYIEGGTGNATNSGHLIKQKEYRMDKSSDWRHKTIAWIPGKLLEGGDSAALEGMAVPLNSRQTA